MTDYIDRQAVIDMFQRNAYDDWNQGVSTTWANAFSECADMVEDISSADVVEVVRCWNCVWWDTCPSSTIAPAFHRCKRVGRMGTEANDFCSFGERKDV